METKLKRARAFASGLLLVLLATLLAACGGSDSSNSAPEGGGTGTPTKVTVATQPWIGYGPMWIAHEKGFDKKNGVNLDIVNFSTDQDLESGFASGKFQAASNANNTYIRLADLGIDFQITLMEDFSLTADAIVSCNPDIKTINDLEGATVAFEEFSVSDVLFRYALKQAGISFDTIDYKPIPAADAGTAAVAGRVDVAVTYEPYLQAAIKEGKNCRIIYTAKERPGLISDALAFSSDFAKSNPEAVVGVMKAWGEAVDFYNSDTEEAQAIIAKAVGESPKALGPSFKGIKLFDLEQSRDFLENEYAGLWKDIGQIMLDQGQIKEIPDVGTYLDLEPGRKALEGGK